MNVGIKTFWYSNSQLFATYLLRRKKDPEVKPNHLLYTNEFVNAMLKIMLYRKYSMFYHVIFKF